MKKLNLFSNLWSSLVGSRKDDGSTRLRVVFDSFTCRLRVWQVISSRMAAVFLLLLTLSIGNAWGAYSLAYTLDCASASSGGSQSAYGVNNTTVMEATGVKAFLNAAAGSTLISSNPTISGSIYWAKGNGGDGIPSDVLKVGKASAGGSIEFTIGGSKNITKVVITGYGWKTTSTISVNGADGQSPTTAASETTFTFEGLTATKTISITVTTSAVCITSIELYETASSYPTITTSSSMTTFGCNMSTGVPTKQSFSVSGSNLTANLSVTPPSGYEICLTENGTYQSSAISLTPTTGTVNSTTIYVRLKDTNAAGSYSGNIACASTDATTQNVAISGSTPFTVTWQANGGTHATTYVAYATGTGTDVGTLPDEPDPADYSCSGKEFYGWYTGFYSHLTTAPTPLVTTSTKVTKDTTFVAVFADEEVGDPAFSKYQLVTSAPSDWSGKYVLSTGTYTATGSIISNVLACDETTPGTTETTSREFTIAKIGETSTYSIKKGSLFYGLQASDKTNIVTDADGPSNSTSTTAAKYAWQISTSAIASNLNTDRKLSCDQTTPLNGIKGFSKPASYIIKLYKRIEEPSFTYSDFVTTCSSSKVKTPQISLSAGTYIGSQSVTITCGTADATIYYTTDNSTPSSSNGSTYSSAITISSTTTLKAIAVKDGLDDSNVASAAYTIRACKTYSLVTDVSTLGMGDKIVILETAGSCALDTTQNASGYRETTTDFALSGSTVRVPDVKPGIQIITLEPYPNALGYWYFNVGSDKYLYATGSSNNYLRTSNKATVTTNANGKWSIALATSVFTVKTNGDATRNKLLYNYNSGTDPRFCCYAENASFTNVKVYALQNTSPTVYVSTTSLSGFSATYGSASDAKDVVVSGRNLTGSLTVTPPTGYEVKKSGDASYSSEAITLTQSSGNVSVTLNVRLKSGINVGSYNDNNLTIVGANSEVSTNVALTGSVSKATPVITFTLDETAALANTEVGYTLSSTSSESDLTFSYVRGGSAVSSMITNDQVNKKISISQAGTYKIRVNQAADDNHNAAAQVEQELTITVRDVFKDMVNGYSDINGDDTGSGITTPTFADMESGAQNTCHSTTRYLIGWIKAADLTTIYSGETGYLEDAEKYEANKAKIVAPGAATTASGVTWYAVWGEGVTP